MTTGQMIQGIFLGLFISPIVALKLLILYHSIKVEQEIVEDRKREQERSKEFKQELKECLQRME